MELASQTAAWEVHSVLPEAKFQQYRQAGIEPILAQLLYNRAITTPAEMRAFLDAHYDQTPDPLALIDMDRALVRIQRAIAQREHITVYGDYDADGVTSSALLTRALRALKHPEATLDFHIPSRVHDGCGLNITAINTLKARGTTLIITTDCASSDIEQVAYARSLDIDVIITDHHQPPQQLPDACAMINPWRPDSTSSSTSKSDRYLCGAGIAFKLAQALYRAYNRPMEEEQALLDLVAVGTIADVAPLLGENHILVRLGMQKLNQTHKPGLLALMQRAGLQPGKIGERDISFALAPRINAAGRMKDASLAFQLLTTDDREEASRYAEELEQLNLSRQRLTEELMSSVRGVAQLRPHDQVVLVSGENWPEGIIGLVAGRLSEELHRPVLVLSKGPEYSRGSARSQKGLNIISALRDCAGILERYGGHAQAAGFTIANDRVEDLREHLLRWNGQEEPPTVAALAVGPVVAEANQADAVIEQESATLSTHTRMIDLTFTRPELLNYSTYSKLRKLGPFGASNPEPIFKIQGLRIVNRWPSGVDGRNLRLQLAAGNLPFKGSLLRGGSRLSAFQPGQFVDVIFSLEPAWNPTDDATRQEIWLKILDLEPAQ